MTPPDDGAAAAPATADLYDAHGDRLQVAESAFRSFGARVAFHGPVATVKCHEDNSHVKAALAEPGHGRVLVVDGGGSRRRALVGDQIAASAVANGWAGVVVWGCIRDSAVVAGLDLGCLALGTVPAKTEKRGEGQRDVPVSFAGVRFEPGAHVYVDADGLVVAPEALHG